MVIWVVCKDLKEIVLAYWHFGDAHWAGQLGYGGLTAGRQPLPPAGKIREGKVG